MKIVLFQCAEINCNNAIAEDSLFEQKYVCAKIKPTNDNSSVVYHTLLMVSQITFVLQNWNIAKTNTLFLMNLSFWVEDYIQIISVFYLFFIF